MRNHTVRPVRTTHSRSAAKEQCANGVNVLCDVLLSFADEAP